MIEYELRGRVVVLTLNRPEVRNAVDTETASQLSHAFRRFDSDAEADVAVLTGAGGTFSAGFDLKAMSRGDRARLDVAGDGPMGPTRMRLSKPVIGAIEGYAVAGGLELALWCDLRVAAEDAVLGVFNRRFGVPLVDLGTIRLPRIIGHARALDLILTGRPVSAAEALRMGLVNRVTEPGGALSEAVRLGEALAAFPQTALREDRLSVLEQWGLDEQAAAENELQHGLKTIASGEPITGSERFAAGEGRRGSFEPDNSTSRSPE